MLRVGIIGESLVGAVRTREGVKVTAATYCNHLKGVLDPWLVDIQLSFLRTSSIQAFLISYDIQGERLMV